MFEKQIDVTVFTPTYNRAYIIPKLYESLRMQTFRNFEWGVINDGSTDNTDELFSKWLKEDNFFTIKYIKVENGGKHRAINKGVQNANGRLFFIVDSDDYLTDDALLKIKETENSIPTSEKEKFAGVCGQKGKTKTEPIGTSFNGECLDILSIDRLKYGICGDKAEAFYTSVMKRYPFPEFEYEKFLSECLVWNEMAMDGLKLRFFNDIIYICEYRNDGLTAQGDNLFVKNPKGWGGGYFSSC